MHSALTTAAVAVFLTLGTYSLAAPPDAPDDDRPKPGPTFDAAYVDQVNRSARGLGIGLDQGFWGSGFANGLRLDVPFGRRFGQFFGVRARGLLAYGPNDADTFDPALLGGIELFGRSPVMNGLARMYGGGGVYIGGRPNPRDDGESTFGVSGGGHMGIELFLMPSFAFSVEIGGQGGVHGLGIDAGASAMGGMTFYVGG